MIVPKTIIRIVMSQGRGSGNCCSMPKAEDNSFPGFFIAGGQQFDRFSSSYERIVSLPYKYHSGRNNYYVHRYFI